MKNEPIKVSNRTRATRSDAIANTGRLLDAARQLFDEKGASVTMDEISKLAGVGNATMYRRFPTRSDLLAEVYTDQVAALSVYGTRLLGSSDPGDAMFAWLVAFVTHVFDKRELALAATDGNEQKRGELFRKWHDSMFAAVAILLRRCQEVGVVRNNVTATDVLVLANALVLASSDLAEAHRMLGFVRDGIAT